MASEKESDVKVGGEVIGIRTIKNGPFHDYVKLAGPEDAEAIEGGCTLHTLFGGTDADGGHWTCHSRLGIAWPAQYSNYEYPAATNTSKESQ